MSTVLYSPYADRTASGLAGIFLSAAVRLWDETASGESKLPTHYTNFIGEELVSGASLHTKSSWLPYIATDVDNGWVSFGVALNGCTVNPIPKGGQQDKLVWFTSETRCLKIYEPAYDLWCRRLPDDYATGCMRNLTTTERTIGHIANVLYAYGSAGQGEPFVPGKYNLTAVTDVRYLPRPVGNSRNTYGTLTAQELMEALL